jgi:TPR repeat protein
MSDEQPVERPAASEAAGVDAKPGCIYGSLIPSEGQIARLSSAPAGPLTADDLWGELVSYALRTDDADPLAVEEGKFADSEPPFDAPALEELGAPLEDEAPASEPDAGEPEAASAPLVLQPVIALKPIKPAATPLHSSAPFERMYLQHARQAAIARARLQRSRISAPKLALGAVMTGLAAPLLAFGAWSALNGANTDREPPPLLQTTEAVAAPEPAPRNPLQDYRSALAHLERGDERAALPLLQSAAEAGVAAAQYRLAKIYEHGGDAAPRDLAMARDLTERAASAGNCRAMHDLGVYYARGEGVARDEAQAAHWFRQAAERGVVDSQYNLALLYQSGRGVEASPEQALFWFLVAARQHDLNAIDRAVALAAQLAPDAIESTQSAAREFVPRPADPVANGAVEPGAQAQCARPRADS